MASSPQVCNNDNIKKGNHSNNGNNCNSNDHDKYTSNGNRNKKKYWVPEVASTVANRPSIPEATCTSDQNPHLARLATAKRCSNTKPN